MLNTSNTMTPAAMLLTGKVAKAARLAMSAERIGNEHECECAALRAGALLRQDGMELDILWAALPELATAPLAWNSIVDGWYSATSAN